jgi:hypothetical protein
MKNSKNKFQENRIFVLNDPNSPRLSPKLAEEIGLNESILFLQIEFWISISNNFKEGKKWTYQSIRDILEFFPFWSVGTIHRTIKSLINQKLITVKTFNKRKNDKTQWFSLNLEVVNNLNSLTIPTLKQEVSDLNFVFQNGTANSEMEQSCSKLEQNCSKTEQTLFSNGTTLPEKDNSKTTQKDLEGFSLTNQIQNPIVLNGKTDLYFNKFWKFYNRREGDLMKVRETFKENIKTENDYQDLIKATRNYNNLTSNRDLQYMKQPINFLTCYKDYIKIDN